MDRKPFFGVLQALWDIKYSNRNAGEKYIEIHITDVGNI